MSAYMVLSVETHDMQVVCATARHLTAKNWCYLHSGGGLCAYGRRDAIHHHLLEVTFETATVPESRQKLL